MGPRDAVHRAGEESTGRWCAPGQEMERSSREPAALEPRALEVDTPRDAHRCPLTHTGATAVFPTTNRIPTAAASGKTST